MDNRVSLGGFCGNGAWHQRVISQSIQDRRKTSREVKMLEENEMSRGEEDICLLSVILYQIMTFGYSLSPFLWQAIETGISLP